METQTPRWVEQDELSRDPALQDWVRSLVARFGRELSVAVARSSLAPHLLVSRGAPGVFFVNRRPIAPWPAWWTNGRGGRSRSGPTSSTSRAASQTGSCPVIAGCFSLTATGGSTAPS